MKTSVTCAGSVEMWSPIYGGPRHYSPSPCNTCSGQRVKMQTPKSGANGIKVERLTGTCLYRVHQRGISPVPVQPPDRMITVKWLSFWAPMIERKVLTLFRVVYKILNYTNVS